QHHEIVRQHTTAGKEYSRLNNAFQYQAVLLTPEVQQSEWGLKQVIYKWNDQELTEQKTKHNDQYGSNTQLFLSFFTPIYKQNNLNKPQSNWEVYLLVDDK